jgi:hypothetical protein
MAVQNCDQPGVEPSFQGAEEEAVCYVSQGYFCQGQTRPRSSNNKNPVETLRLKRAAVKSYCGER